MTRADEIATEFEAPYPGEPELFGERPRQRAHAPRSDGSTETDAPATVATAETSESDREPGAARTGRPQVNGTAGPNGRRRVMRVDPAGSVELDEEGPGPSVDSGDAPGATPGDASAAPAPPATETPGHDSGPAEKKVVHAPHHDTLPEKARSAAGTWLKAAGWTAGTSFRVSNHLVKLATDPGSAQDVLDEVTKEVREVARDFLGISDLDAQVQEMAPLLSSGLLKAGGSSPEALRAQGEALLRAAADVGFDESAHPAFARILTELSPDEARILRLLAIEGSQPMVDVRATNLIGNGSQLIAQSLNMLGPKAGLRQRARVPVYLTNLARLSLVNLSDDPLERPVEYQVLEAQPEVLSTLRDAVRAKTIRRSVHLTPFGREFCEVCLPVNLPQLPPAGH